MRRLLILLDTTALWTDPWLESADIRALLTLHRHGVQVLISNVVLLEHERHVREEIKACIKTTLRTLGKLSRLTGLTLPSPVHAIDADDAAKHYAQEMRRRLEAAGAIIMAIPGVSHEELVNRAIERKKPFADAGRGYRDALIWYSAMAVIDKMDAGDVVQLICVTNNTDDFGGEKGLIHQDLQNEATARRDDIAITAFLARTVNEAWDERIAWLAPRSPELEKEFGSGQLRGVDVKEWLICNGAKSLAGRSFGGATTSPGVSDEFGPVVFSITEVVTLDSAQVRNLPNAEIHVRFSAVFKGMFDIYQFKPEDEDEDERRDPFCNDRDWTEVSTGEGTFRAHFTLLVDSDGQNVIAADGQPGRIDTNRNSDA